MNIIGAGLAGLLAANYFRKQAPTVHEQQASLPHNHEALLRFRTDRIGKACGIPFREVQVRKAILSGDSFVDYPNMYLCNIYSLKMTGRIMDRSIWNMEPGKRYIAPKNLIEQLSTGVDFRFGRGVTATEFKVMAAKGPVISTIPMPLMMKIMGWKGESKFNYQPIWAISFEILSPVTDVYQTIYFPDLDDDRYRASITGDKVSIELVREPNKDQIGPIMQKTLDTFGIPHQMVQIDAQKFICKKQAYGKIVPIPEQDRQEFIYWLSREHNIYSLGRFATWRQLLLDDLVNDLQVIEKLVRMERSRSQYFQAITETKQAISSAVN